MPSDTPRHISVLLANNEGDPSPVLDLLQPKRGERVLDVTLGLAGHAQAFLRATAPNGTLVGLDADEENLECAKEKLHEYRDRTTLIHANFRNIDALALGTFDIVFGDLGLSSPHLDLSERGFSFRGDAPLDLRFDRTTGKTGAQLLATIDSYDLTAILRDLGGLERPRRLSEALSTAFRGGASRTTDVKNVVESVYGYKAASLLPQVFQAVRIAVNGEIASLESLLAAVPQLLRLGGRAGIISYHSLEDRLVKETFRTLSTPKVDDVTGAETRPASFSLVTRKAVVPTQEEIARNPRSRSAKFRVLLKKF